MNTKQKLSEENTATLIGILKRRFDTNMDRHKDVVWSKVQAKLELNPDKLWSLNEMERTEGEPDVVGYHSETDEYVFYDCAPESPKGRRSICYDHEALESRKEHKPKHSALGMAKEMGITLLTEEQYHALQQLGQFDRKTSSWLLAPAEVRALGGAVFGDRRYDRVFIYHNGAESYYAARGFRGALNV